MNNLRDLFSKEPALTRGLILSILGVLVSWGLPIDAAQKQEIATALVTAAPVLLGFFIRGRVSPAASPQAEPVPVLVPAQAPPATEAPAPEVLDESSDEPTWPAPDAGDAVPAPRSEIYYGHDRP